MKIKKITASILYVQSPCNNDLSRYLDDELPLDIVDLTFQGNAERASALSTGWEGLSVRTSGRHIRYHNAEFIWKE